MHFFKFKPASARQTRLCRKSATYIILLCVPALALFVSMTLPSWVFQSPDQEAYYYFARAFSNDLAKGYLLALSALCMLLVFAMPAVPQGIYMEARY